MLIIINAASRNATTYNGNGPSSDLRYISFLKHVFCIQMFITICIVSANVYHNMYCIQFGKCVLQYVLHWKMCIAICIALENVYCNMYCMTAKHIILSPSDIQGGKKTSLSM